MIHLDAKDSAYSDGTVANAPPPDHQRLRLVGASPRRRARPLIKPPACPTSPTAGPDLSNLPLLQPSPTRQRLPLTVFKVLKAKFRSRSSTWHPVANATASTPRREGVRACGSPRDSRSSTTQLHASQTTFLPNVLTMKSDGVQLFFTPDARLIRRHLGRGDQSQTSSHRGPGDAYSSNW